MADQSRRNAWGFSIFCDDFRQEVLGKYSLMGVYQNDMVFSSDITFPFIVPRSVILVKYFETVGAFKDALLLRVYLPGDEADKPTIAQAIERGTNAPMAVTLEADQEQVVTFTVPLIFSPFEVRQEGFVKVRMHCGDVITNLGSLRIHKVPFAQVSTP